MPLELALDVADPPLALALALALELTLPLALPPTELVTVTTPVAEPDPTEPNSVGTDVLNASVTGTTGASVVSDPAVRDPGDAVVAAETGVLPPTTFVNGCAELPSSESVETSTLNGSPPRRRALRGAETDERKQRRRLEDREAHLRQSRC